MSSHRKFSPGSRKAPDPIDQFLEEQGFYRKHTARDSTCLFRVLSEQLYDCQKYHGQVRQDCVDFMRKNKILFQNDIGNNYYSYLSEMEKHRTFGTILELKAAAYMHKRNVVLFQAYDIGKRIIYSKMNKEYFRLYFSPEKHYDSIYTDEYTEQAAFCQAICYEMLYKQVLKLPDVMYAVERMLYDPDNLKMHLMPNKFSERIITDDGNEFILDSPENTNCILENYKLCHFHNKHFEEFSLSLNHEINEYKIKDTKHINRIMESLLPEKNVSCIRQLLDCGITPFPYKVAKALDPYIYRNIEFDAWNEARKELRFKNWCKEATGQLQVGVKCRVKLRSSESNLYTCHIQEMPREDKGPCVVFVEGLGEKHIVPYTNLEFLPSDTFKPWIINNHNNKRKRSLMTNSTITSTTTTGNYKHDTAQTATKINSSKYENYYLCENMSGSDNSIINDSSGCLSLKNKTTKNKKYNFNRFNDYQEIEPGPIEMVAMPIIYNQTLHSTHINNNNNHSSNQLPRNNNINNNNNADSTASSSNQGSNSKLENVESKIENNRNMGGGGANSNDEKDYEQQQQQQQQQQQFAYEYNTGFNFNGATFYHPNYETSYQQINPNHPAAASGLYQPVQGYPYGMLPQTIPTTPTGYVNVNSHVNYATGLNYANPNNSIPNNPIMQPYASFYPQQPHYSLNIIANSVPMNVPMPNRRRDLLQSSYPINFSASPSYLISGNDLPINDVPTLRFFYNMGQEYFKLLQVQYGTPAVLALAHDTTQMSMLNDNDNDNTNESDVSQLVNDIGNNFNIDDNNVANNTPNAKQENNQQTSTNEYSSNKRNNNNNYSKNDNNNNKGSNNRNQNYNKNNKNQVKKSSSSGNNSSNQNTPLVRTSTPSSELTNVSPMHTNLNQPQSDRYEINNENPNHLSMPSPYLFCPPAAYPQPNYAPQYIYGSPYTTESTEQQVFPYQANPYQPYVVVPPPSQALGQFIQAQPQLTPPGTENTQYIGANPPEMITTAATSPYDYISYIHPPHFPPHGQSWYAASSHQSPTIGYGAINPQLPHTYASPRTHHFGNTNGKNGNFSTNNISN